MTCSIAAITSQDAQLADNVACMASALFTAIHDMDASGAHLVEHAHREDELAAVARIQAEAFFEASPIAPLDPLLYYMFQVCIWPRCTLCLIP